MKKVEEYFKELLEQHPYKQRGNRDSYSQYNEGWQDALDLAIQVAKQMQIDTIEETCKKILDTCAYVNYPMEDNRRICGEITTKQSILNCIKILKKEIE